MFEDLHVKINALKEAASPWYVGCAGGLEFLLGAISSVEGISSHYLGATSCYHPRLFERFCGTKAHYGFCSQEASLVLARAAFREGRSLGQQDAFGIGITASLATKRPVRGGHRVWVACFDGKSWSTEKLELSENESRSSQITRATPWILDRIYEFVTSSRCEKDYHLDVNKEDDYDIGEMYRRAELAPVLVEGNGNFVDCKASALENAVVFPGSFNPIHYGHLRIAQLVYLLAKREVVFEICLSNADPRKLPLKEQDLVQRLSMLRGARVILSNLPYFVDKANFYRTDFAVGADTWNRLFDASYFREGESEGMLRRTFKDLGTQFFVFERQDSPMESFPFTIPARWNVSSSKLRAKAD